MTNNDKLNLFISYSHQDESLIKEFVKHITPLRNNGLISEWYDRKILGGSDFLDSIENNLEKANIICLFISADFLASQACLNEKIKALELKKKKGISIVPIILSSCGWKDDKEISVLLALPTDGKPISDFPDQNNAWNIVYNELKKIIEQENNIRNIEISAEFKKFLNNSELLSQAHSKKTEVSLDDIFIYPELTKYDAFKAKDKKLNGELLIESFKESFKIVIAGEDQAGKTTLCKKLFVELRQRNFIPIYINDKSNHYQGLIENKLEAAFKEQYAGMPLNQVEKKRIVPILDDFHFAKKKEKHLDDLASYDHQIIIVDDIFGLNLTDENLIKSFEHYMVNQFPPSLRNKLIKKWISIDGNGSNLHRENDNYKNIDSATELVNSTLGKVINSGIMPAYPFFILSVISTHEAYEKPLDQEISSQGYCYQALIYLYLRKHGIKNDEVDMYVNFLAVIAHHFFSTEKQELTEEEFNIFILEYEEKYNLPIKKEILKSNLQKTKFLYLNSCNNYYFYYSYLYYYFVAKYLAEHLDESKENIDQIIANLHKDENAYIAIFISHHSKSSYILDRIILNSKCLFEKYQPATLTKDELKFFDDKIESIVQAVLPPSHITPESERAKRLKNQDVIEEKYREAKTENTKSSLDDNKEEALLKELRRSVKTVEVMGRIIKNRAGSMEKIKLENIFEEAMNVHLRILASFFDIIKDDKTQHELLEFIDDRLEIIIKDKEWSQEKRKKKAIEIFWNLNFWVIYANINKIIQSIGSDKLYEISQKVCDKMNSPASFLVNHGILMWYGKNIQIENISNKIKEGNFSKTAQRVMKHLIVNHCSIHKIEHRDKQKIENKLGIPSYRLSPKKS